MVDRVYKGGIPELRKDLEKLRDDFLDIGSKTNWVKMRIEPVLRHAETLEQLMVSPEFSQDFSHLTKGVVLFHSDLVYLRTNVKGLKEIFRSEKRSSDSRKK